MKRRLTLPQTTMSRTARCVRAALASGLSIAALAALAPPAAADTSASFSNGTGYSRCETVWQYGTLYAYGAWGRYIDGCTASARCPYPAGCVLQTAYGHLQHYTPQSNQRSTCNSRLRVFTAAGYLRFSQDRSGTDYAWCNASHSGALPVLSYGETATMQANGVRNDVSAYARIISHIVMLDWNGRCEYYYQAYGC